MKGQVDIQSLAGGTAFKGAVKMATSARGRTMDVAMTMSGQVSRRGLRERQVGRGERSVRDERIESAALRWRTPFRDDRFAAREHVHERGDLPGAAGRRLHVVRAKRQREEIHGVRVSGTSCARADSRRSRRADRPGSVASVALRIGA